MVLQTNEVCQIISTLSDDSGLKVTVNESLKGGLITGIVCTIGGLILGPVGLAFGGTLGGIVSYLKSDGKFKPVSQIIMYEMEEIHREQLAQSVQTILNEVDATDVMQMMVMIKGNEVLKTRILSEVTNFIQTQLQLSIL